MKLGTDWNLLIDNDFARQVSLSISSRSLPLPEIPLSSGLCPTCQVLRKDLWNPWFGISYSADKLKDNSIRKNCGLCGLLWKVYEKQGGAGLPDVFFQRVGSSIRINEVGPPALSIHRSLGK